MLTDSRELILFDEVDAPTQVTHGPPDERQAKYQQANCV
jgi:hypothetical protein